MKQKKYEIIEKIRMRKQIVLVLNAESRVLILIPIILPLLTGRPES